MNVLVFYMSIFLLCSHNVHTSFRYVRFQSLKRLKYFRSRILYYHNSSATFQTEIYRVENCVFNLILLSGDVETNPGPTYVEHVKNQLRIIKTVFCVPYVKNGIIPNAKI